MNTFFFKILSTPLSTVYCESPKFTNASYVCIHAAWFFISYDKVTVHLQLQNVEICFSRYSNVAFVRHVNFATNIARCYTGPT